MVTKRAPEILYEIHEDVPRGGPGSYDATRRAFRMLTELPVEPEILDIGCGPGRQTLDLASLSPGRITAVDNHQPFLDRLRHSAEDRGFGLRITPINADMFNLRFPPGSFDLIWAEGSIYLMGFETGLLTWKQFLRRPGFMAVTEVTWLRKDRPEKVIQFWEKEYPAITDIEGNLTTIKQCGFSPMGYFTLPESAWWNDFYTPIKENLPALREKYKDDEEALNVIRAEEKEIELYRRFSDYYGYVFYIMKTD